MTAATLRSRTAKDLAQMARRQGIQGWHTMRKDELIDAILTLSLGLKGSAPEKLAKSPARANGAQSKDRDPQAQTRIQEMKQKLAIFKNLAAGHQQATGEESPEDRLVVMVRDPYWLHAFWELSQRSVDRAQAAMGQRWHTAQPTLRVFRLFDTGTAKLERDIAVHGGVSNWYVDVPDPPCSFRLEIGYLATDGSFFSLARSSSVQTPPAGASNAIDENWADVAEHADQIYAMSGGYSPQGTSRELQELLEQRLRRPLGTPMHTRFGSGASGKLPLEQEMPLTVDAEVVIHGATARNAHVTLRGAPVQLRDDGTFSVRLNFPDQRQVIPIVASSSDGVEQRTVILALERNTKRMEPVIRDQSRPLH